MKTTDIRSPRFDALAFGILAAASCIYLAFLAACSVDPASPSGREQPPPPLDSAEAIAIQDEIDSILEPLLMPPFAFCAHYRDWVVRGLPESHAVQENPEGFIQQSLVRCLNLPERCSARTADSMRFVEIVADTVPRMYPSDNTWSRFNHVIAGYRDRTRFDSVLDTSIDLATRMEIAGRMRPDTSWWFESSDGWIEHPETTRPHFGFSTWARHALGNGRILVATYGEGGRAQYVSGRGSDSTIFSIDSQGRYWVHEMTSHSWEIHGDWRTSRRIIEEPGWLVTTLQAEPWTERIEGSRAPDQTFQARIHYVRDSTWAGRVVPQVLEMSAGRLGGFDSSWVEPGSLDAPKRPAS